MKKFHSFYFIGTFGVVITAIFHITLALGFGLSQGHTTFYVLYTLFATFLILGVALTVKNQNDLAKSSKQD